MSNNTDIGLTTEAWADIVIKKWEDKIDRLKIKHTGTLLSSFEHDANKASGSVERITFLYEYYGRMVDMGVGKGTKIEDVGITSERRKPKPWYNKVFASQVKKLTEIMAEKYARKGVILIIDNIEK